MKIMKTKILFLSCLLVLFQLGVSYGNLTANSKHGAVGQKIAGCIFGGIGYGFWGSMVIIVIR